MPRTKKKPAAPILPDGIFIDRLSFRWSVEYDWDTDRDCESHGCSDICRCSVMSNLRVTSTHGVGPDVFKILSRKTVEGKQAKKDLKFSDIESYCIRRLMVSHGCYNCENYDFSVGNGFYGEEIDNIRFTSESDLQTDVFRMLNLETDHAKVMYALNVEYGVIADIIKDTTQAEIVKEPIENVQPSAGAIMLKRQTEYLYPLEKDSVIGILLERLLIDGNHRMSYKAGLNEKGAIGTFIRLS